MVNQVVLEYLRTNRGNFKMADLKKKILASGYMLKDINEAVVQLKKEGAKAVPSVPATINKINNTNIDMVAKPEVANVGGQKVEVKPLEKVKSVKKKKGWLFWLILVWILLLVLGGAGFAIWYFVFS